MPPHELLILPQAPPTEQLPPEIREAVAGYRFTLEDGRSLLLTLDHGHLSLEEGAGGKADCMLSCSMELFHRILNGEANLLTAFLRSDVRASGNLEVLLRLHRFLRLCRGRGEHP